MIKIVRKIVYNKQGSAYIIDDQLPESNNREIFPYNYLYYILHKPTDNSNK